MKKILTFLLTALLAFGVGWAETVTFVGGTDVGSTTNQSSDSMTKGGITISSTSAGLAYSEYRFYNGTITISSTVGNITSVVFTCTSSSYSNVLYGSTPSTGSFSQSGNTVTWTGGASSFTIRNTAQFRASQIVVTIASVGVDPPTITPNGGNFATSQQVTLSHADADAIYYTLDGNDPTTSSTPYTAPFTITTTTTVKAIAEKNGVTSSPASATFTNIGVGTIADAYALAQGSQFIFTGNAVVTYQNGSRLFIRDNSGSGMIYGSGVGTYTNGDILDANWSATNTTYSSLIHQFGSPTGVTSSSNGGAVAPFDKTSTGVTAANVHEYVSFSNVTLSWDDNIGYTYVTIGNNTVYFRDFFSNGFTVTSGHTYDIEGIVYIERQNNNNIEYTVVYLTSVTEVQPTTPTLLADPTSLTINDSGTGNTFTVEGSNLGTDNVGLTQTDGTNFDPTLSATTGSTYDGGTYWGFTPAGGSVNGTVAMEYTGRALSASETVTLGNNTGASATVTVNYLADLYIVGNFGSGWDFSTGTPMTYNNGTYTASVTVDAGNLILFARKYDANELWNTRYVFGPNSSGDWWVNGDVATGIIDLNDDDPIYFSSAGTYIIEINASTGALTVTKEVVNTGDFVLVTDANDLVAGDEVIIVNSGTAGSARTMGQRNNNNYFGTDVTVSNTLKVTPTNDTQIFTLEQGTGGWYFKTSDDLYLNTASSGTGNNLQTKDKDANGTGTSLAVINIGSDNAASIVFQGSGTRKTMKYNVNNLASGGNDIFSCYQSNANLAAVYIYRRTASTEPSITVSPSTIDIVIPAGETSEQGAAAVTESNTTGTTSVSVTGEDASNFSASLNNGTLTVTYSGTATASDPDVATVTLTNGTATATVNVTGYKEPMTVTITPGDGHTFSTSTVTGLIESNVNDVTIEYSFDGTTWYTYNANDGFTTPEVSNIGGTVTVYARATKNGETAMAQVTYTRIAPSEKCTADIVFAPTSNNGGVTQWETLQTHMSEGADYISDASMATVYTSNDYDAFRFGSGNNVGHMTFTLKPSAFTGGAVKLTKVTINAARYSSDTGCELTVSTDVNTTGQTLSITASQTAFADYVFNFDGSEITTLTIANETAGCRVYVHSITLEYNCTPTVVVTPPVITPGTNTYYENQTVHISAADGCTIYFTTDGTDPTTSSPEFTDDFIVSHNAGLTTTVKAIAVDGQGNISDVTSVVYTWGVPSVHIHPDSRNTTASSMTVTLTPNPTGATVYYTTDGSTPTTSSSVYNGPFTVDIPNVGDQATVKAIAVLGSASSPVATATYTHVENVLDVHAPFFSPLEGGHINGNTTFDGIYYGDQTLQIGCTTPNADIYYEIEVLPGTTAPSASSVEDPTHVSTYYDGTTTIPMTVGNSYYVKAISYVGNNPSTIAEGWYTIEAAPTTQNYYTNLKDFNDNCPTGVTAHFVNPVQVVYHSTYTNNGQYAEFCYLRDNTDYACVYFGKRDTGNHTIFSMGDWIDGSQIAGVTNIWERNFHIQLGTGDHEVTSWPSQAIGWSEILPEEMTNDVIVAGTAEGDNVWGHYVHLRNTTLRNVKDYSATDPKHTGLINDGTADAYYYDKFYRWSAGTCTYNTHEDVIHHLGDYDSTFFATKQEAGATFDVYGIVDYYSLYTPPFEVCPIDFLWAYKPVISLPSGSYTGTQTVTITATQPEWAAEGVVIYYKTDDMEEWAVYTGPITVNSDTHIQAYAEVPSEKTNGANYNDFVRSEIVEATYEFLGIEDPLIDPGSMLVEIPGGTTPEPISVTVMDNNDNPNAVTVYTIDGTVPSATNGTVINEITTFDVNQNTTVSAVSYLVVAEGDTLWSNVVTCTYEFIVANGKTYNLLTTNPVVGNIYVIVNKADNVAISKTQNANNRAAIGVTFTDDNKTVVNGNNSLAEFILESANAGRYYFRQVRTQDYLCVTTNANPNLMNGTADVNAEAAATVNSNVTSGVDESYPATITFSYDGTSRYLRYYAGGRVFTTYGDATANQPIFLYGIAAPTIYDPAIDPHTQVVQVTNGDESLTVTVTPNSENPYGAVTYYTTDGSDPRTSSTRIEWNSFNGEFPVTNTTTVKAVTGKAFGDGMVWSNVVSETYTFAGVEPPTISPESQTATLGEASITVTVTPSDQNPAGAMTYYTTDGSDPRTSETRTEWNSQNGTFPVTETTTVKASTCLDVEGTTVWSVTVSETYTFVPPVDSLKNIEATGVVGKVYTVADELVGVWAIDDPETGERLLWAKDQDNMSIDTRPALVDSVQIDYIFEILGYRRYLNGEVQEQVPWDESNWVILDFSDLPRHTGYVTGPDLTDPFVFVGNKIMAESVTGSYENSTNFRIKLREKPELTYPNNNDLDIPEYPGYTGPFPGEKLGRAYDLAYNSYVPANFMPENHNHMEGDNVVGFVSDEDALPGLEGWEFYFLNPKIEEVAHIWAVWNGDDIFTVYRTEVKEYENGKRESINAWNLNGTFRVDWTYNCLGTNPDFNTQLVYGQPTALVKHMAYEFHAAIMRPEGRNRDGIAPQGTAEPDAEPSNAYIVYPLDMKLDGTATAVIELNGTKAVVDVTYYNLMGQQSKQPFDGINIVVTRYSDGSTSSVKVLR